MYSTSNGVSEIIVAANVGPYFMSLFPTNMASPALFSLAIFHFMNNWNDLLYPLMLTSSPAKRTLSAGLAILVGNKVIKYGPTLAATMISLTPLLVLYIVCQKYFVEGIATAGTKE